MSSNDILDDARFEPGQTRSNFLTRLWQASLLKWTLNVYIWLLSTYFVIVTVVVVYMIAIRFNGPIVIIWTLISIGILTVFYALLRFIPDLVKIFVSIEENTRKAADLSKKSKYRFIHFSHTIFRIISIILFFHFILQMIFLIPGAYYFLSDLFPDFYLNLVIPVYWKNLFNFKILSNICWHSLTQSVLVMNLLLIFFCWVKGLISREGNHENGKINNNDKKVGQSERSSSTLVKKLFFVFALTVINGFMLTRYYTYYLKIFLPDKILESQVPYILEIVGFICFLLIFYELLNTRFKKTGAKIVWVVFVSLALLLSIHPLFTILFRSLQQVTVFILFGGDFVLNHYLDLLNVSVRDYYQLPIILASASIISTLVYLIFSDIFRVVDFIERNSRKLKETVGSSSFHLKVFNIVKYFLWGILCFVFIAIGYVYFSSKKFYIPTGGLQDTINFLGSQPLLFVGFFLTISFYLGLVGNLVSWSYDWKANTKRLENQPGLHFFALKNFVRISYVIGILAALVIALSTIHSIPKRADALIYVIHWGVGLFLSGAAFFLLTFFASICKNFLKIEANLRIEGNTIRGGFFGVKLVSTVMKAFAFIAGAAPVIAALIFWIILEEKGVFLLVLLALPVGALLYIIFGAFPDWCQCLLFIESHTSVAKEQPEYQSDETDDPVMLLPSKDEPVRQENESLVAALEIVEDRLDTKDSDGLSEKGNGLKTETGNNDIPDDVIQPVLTEVKIFQDDMSNRCEEIYETQKKRIVEDVKKELTPDEINILHGLTRLTYSELAGLYEIPEDLTEKGIKVFGLLLKKIDLLSAE